MKRTTSSCITAVAILTLASLAFALAGDVDTSFGPDGDGILTLVPPFGGLGDPRLLAPQVELDGSGRMVVFAWGKSGAVRDGAVVDDWRLRRYDANGSLDTTFGVGGEQAYFDEVAAGGIPSAVALDPSGIWMAGRAWRQTVSGNRKRPRVVEEEVWQVARVLASGPDAGDLDPDFNQGAPVVLGTLPVSDDLYGIGAVAVRADGSALVVGHGPVTTASSGGRKKKKGGGGTSSWGFVVAAVKPDGTLDTSYGDAGWARYDLDPSTNNDAEVRSARLQSTGELIVLTLTDGLIRFDAGGSFDASFGTDGTVDDQTVPVTALAVDAADNIYAAGRSNTTFEPKVYRYDADGIADTSFGAGGVVTLAGQFGLAPVGGLAVEEVDAAKRRLIVATGIDDPSSGGIVAVRLLLDGYASPAGSRDAAFGPNGDGVSEPLRKIVDSATGATVGLWNAWDVAVHSGGDITITDAITTYTDALGNAATIESSLGRISGG